jgi:uncharacterized protein (DUF2147 family)
MFTLTRLAGAALLLAFVASPALAAGASPVGSWRSTDGQAQVRVSMCGDGTQLCARLTGLGGEARTPANLQMLNSYVVEGAQRSNTNEWQGTVHLNGQTADGKIVLASANSIVVNGCQMGMCKTFEFRRLGSSRIARLTETVAQMPPRTVGLTIPE